MPALATATWCAEVATALLTLVYCLIVAHDLVSGEDDRLSSRSWFANGFCIWKVESALPRDSHDLCVICDFLIGGGLLVVNYFYGFARLPPAGPGSTAGSTKRAAMTLAVATAGFTMMHGVGHLVLGRVIGEGDFMAEVSYHLAKKNSCRSDYHLPRAAAGAAS
jgi:hypothetical protein